MNSSECCAKNVYTSLKALFSSRFISPPVSYTHLTLPTILRV